MADTGAIKIDIIIITFFYGWRPQTDGTNLFLFCYHETVKQMFNAVVLSMFLRIK